MKKLLILAAITVFGASLALAHGNGYGRGYGMGPGMMGQGYGQGQGYNQGYGPGNCMGNGFQGAAEQVSEDGAREVVQNVIAANFKGFKVKKVEQFRMPMGTMYEVEVVDGNNNICEFHVNPWSNVMRRFSEGYRSQN